jgi:phage protein D
VTGQLRRPRSIIKVNGQVIAGWESWTWDGNSLYQADTFDALFPMKDLPPKFGPVWWAAQTDLDIEIFVGFPANADSFSASDLESIFAGRVDDASFDWPRQCISIAGRDMTAGFLDNKTSEKFPNQTASQIATMLAGRRGLTPVVTATKTKVGRYYQIDNVRMEDDRTEWDLLTWLAREEGFIVYVKGKELHFEPRAKGGDVFRVVWRPAEPGKPMSTDFTSVKTVRTLTVARDLTVIVRSWNSKAKRAFEKKATRNRPKSPNKQQYVYSIPGLTPQQAQERANQLLAELSRHEMKLSVEGPAENALGKAQVIQLSGTGTAFDQTYYPDVIRRSFDASEGGGYRWSISAKNHSPESEPTL